MNGCFGEEIPEIAAQRLSLSENEHSNDLSNSGMGTNDHSSIRASWPRRLQVDNFHEHPLCDFQNKRWSVSSIGVQQEPSLYNDNDCFVDPVPQISAHHYDSTYYGSTYTSDVTNTSRRFSTPLYQSCNNHCFQEQEEVSYSISPSALELQEVNSEDSFTKSSIPDSPPNSSLDYKSPESDVPAIFHRGGGKRGGIRLNSGNIEDLSLLLAVSANIPKSPLNSHSSTSRRSSLSSIHSPASTPSIQPHHISLSNLSSRWNTSSSADNTDTPQKTPNSTISIDSSGQVSSAFNSDSIFVSGHTSSAESSPFILPTIPAIISSVTPDPSIENVSVVPSGDNLVCVSDGRRLNSISTHPGYMLELQTGSGYENHTGEMVSNLLRVLLAISSKYDFKHLRHTVRCHCVDANPNSTPNARLCYDYLNTGKCKREMEYGVCVFRHLPADHIEAVVDKILSGKINVSLIRQVDDGFLVADMPGYNEYSPGELNRNASVDAELCLDFNLNGLCPNERMGRKCPYRHLADCHPEHIAILYRYGRLSDFEANAWILSECDENEVNPFSNSGEKLCYDFMNSGICKRNREGKICRFRHMLPEKSLRSQTIM